MEGLSLADTHELQHPDAAREPIEGLAIKNGWCCGEQHCLFCSISEKHVENHCRTIHGKEATKRVAWFNCQIQTLLKKPYVQYSGYLNYC